MSALLAPLPELLPAEDVEAGGRTCRVRRLGRGPRMVLLHGGPGLDHHLLLPLALPLARHFEVWLPDLPGHGVGAPEGASLPGLASVAGHMERWLGGLPGGVAVLGGHSLGAWLVRELLRKGRVAPRAAVLLAPPGPTPRERGRPRVPPPPTGPGEPQEARDELLAALQEECEEPPCEELLAAVAQARVRRPTAYAALLGELHRVLQRPLVPVRPGCPVLVLGGDRDRTSPPLALAAVASATEESRLRLLRGCGHLPWWHGGEEVADEVCRFLEDVSAPRADSAGAGSRGGG
jgi:pimeloyl-ACP methyl ester carboxylesterase